MDVLLSWAGLIEGRPCDEQTRPVRPQESDDTGDTAPYNTATEKEDNMRKLYLPVVRWLFDGAAGSDAGTTGESQAAPDAAGQEKKTGEDLSTVKYGKQQTPDAAEPTEKNNPPAEPAQAETPEARAKRFDELINGEFKDLYTAKTQELIDRRFAKSKQTENEAATLRDIAGLLNEKYGISDDADYTKLRAAIEGDDDMWAAKAEAEGLTVDQYKEFARLQRRNAAYEAARQNDIAQQMQQQKLNKWAQEAQALKEKYPDFDLRYELENTPGFIQALDAGAPMEILYTGAHYAELTAATAKQTEQKLVSNIRAKGQRPSENGTASQGAAFTVKSDPSKLTLKDYEEIQRRVRNGEVISF